MRPIFQRARTCAQPRLPLLCAAVAVAACAASPVAAGDYTLHMLAHVAQRCTVHRASSEITLTADHDDAGGVVDVLRGDGGFRIACNVPYVFDFRTVKRRTHFGRLTPIAALAPPVAERAPRSFDLTVFMAGRDGPLEGHCSLSDLAPGDNACMPISASDDPRLAAPRGDVRLALVATGSGSQASDAAKPALVAPPAAAPLARADGLRIVVQPRH